MQGEREMARDNRSLGRFILDGIPPAPRGIPQIEVTFDIDANGIVSVKARDKGTGREQHITIQPSSGLAKDEIDRIIREAESHANDDRRRREEAEVRNQAESEAYNAEKTLRELGDKVPEDLRQDVATKVADVRAALDSNDLERIKASRETLMQSLYKISEQIYSAMGADGGAAPTEGGPPAHRAAATMSWTVNTPKSDSPPHPQAPRAISVPPLLCRGAGDAIVVYIPLPHRMLVGSLIKEQH